MLNLYCSNSTSHCTQYQSTKEQRLWGPCGDNQEAASKAMNAKQNVQRYPHKDYLGEGRASFSSSPDEYKEWVRGSWFPPFVKKDCVYNGTPPLHLFSPPLTTSGNGSS